MRGICVEEHQPARSVGQAGDEFLLRLLHGPAFPPAPVASSGVRASAFQHCECRLGLSKDGLEVLRDVVAGWNRAQYRQ